MVKTKSTVAIGRGRRCRCYGSERIVGIAVHMGEVVKMLIMVCKAIRRRDRHRRRKMVVSEVSGVEVIVAVGRLKAARIEKLFMRKRMYWVTVRVRVRGEAVSGDSLIGEVNMILQFCRL